MKSKLLLPLLVLFLACNTANKPITEIQKEAVKKEASQVIKSVFEILETGNGEERMEMCENSHDFTFFLADRIFSYDELKNYVQQALQDAEKEILTKKSEKYIILDHDCFVYLWNGKIDIYLKSGEVMSFSNYFSTWTFRKTDGKWKMVSGHETYI